MKITIVRRASALLGMLGVVGTLGLTALTAPAQAAATTALGSPETGAQAVAYWKFRNKVTNTCLSAGAKGTVLVTTCTSSNYQKWSWTGSGSYRYLKNRATGLCLETAINEGTKKVKVAKCGKKGVGYPAAQRWRTRKWSSGYLVESQYSGALRTDARKGAVYVSASGGHGKRPLWSVYRA